MTSIQNIKTEPLLVPTLLVGLVVILNMFFVEQFIFGTIGFFIYFILLSIVLGKRISKLMSGLEQFFWGSLSLLGIFIILNTITYYIFAITEITAIITLVLPLAIFLFKKTKGAEKKIKKEKEVKNLKYPTLAFLAFDFGLLFTLIGNRTTELLRSPWHVLEPKFFLVWAVATGLLFFIVYKTKKVEKQLLFSSLHLFITLGVAAIVYPLGFGFDAFVHRAAENWIFMHGFVDPKTPYYIGQYSLVAWLRHLTGIPLFYIDIYLVPTLASLTLPAMIGLSLKKIWNIPLNIGLLFVWIIPFVPFLTGYLNLTTPFNLAFLFAIITMFTTLTYLKNKISFFIPAILAFTAFITHALIGAPLLIFAVASWSVKKFGENKKMVIRILTLSTIATILAVPALFVMRNLMLGLGFPKLNTSLANFGHFFDLFERPYWFADSSPIIFELLYGWAWFIVPIVLILAIVGTISPSLSKRGVGVSSKTISLLFISTSLALFLSAWLLRSWIVFPDVVSYEQGDFPLRLIKLSLVFLLPFAIYGLYFVHKKISKKKILFTIYYLLFTIFLTLSFYLSYPQHNPKARFPGLNVTQSDYNAVEWIHEQHDEYDYIVLSNQLVSAAALTNYSFIKYFDTPRGELFYYSIPTGGPLYKQYGRMLYEGQKREYMEAAMNISDVSTSYFVINSYWANAEKIIEGAKKTADSWQSIDDGNVWIFEYNK